jgi:nucleoside-diphosphate-sugar epimerase
MRVLVTGAAGYIGRIVARELARDHQVRGLDMRPMPELADARVLDLNDYEAVREALEGVQAVAHLAWPIRQYPGVQPRESTDLGAGVRGLYQLLRATVAEGIQRFVFQSTINVTWPSWDNWRVTEDEQPRPGPHGYTLGKTLAEEMCRSFSRCHPLTVAVIRFGGVFTLEEDGYESAGPALHPVPGTCVERRDIAQAYALALTRPLPSRFEIFHIFHARPGERFPIDKAQRVLGYAPRYNEEQLWRA